MTLWVGWVGVQLGWFISDFTQCCLTCAAVGFKMAPLSCVDRKGAWLEYSIFLLLQFFIFMGSILPCHISNQKTSLYIGFPAVLSLLYMIAQDLERVKPERVRLLKV